MLLQHIHLRTPPLTSYLHACQLQLRIASSHLAFKTLSTAERATRSPPSPTLLTFETRPTYTSGRRETDQLTSQQIAHLRANGAAEYHPSTRGGLTTFHGPGQLTAFLICSLDIHGLGAATYVHFLENALIQTCSHYGVATHTTQNPGVWVTAQRKIASVGVHLRRYVSTFGTGLNVNTDLQWFDRIVACGLEGKETTSIWAELKLSQASIPTSKTSSRRDVLALSAPTVEQVATVLASNIASGLRGVTGVTSDDESKIS